MKQFVVQEAHYLEISPALMHRIQRQAADAGLTVVKYVEKLVVSESKPPKDDPWSEPLPWEVEKQYIQDAIKFYEEDLKNPKAVARSAKELLALLQADETD